MFCIKICGITNVEDARAAADAGADAIGLNFFSKSRRFVEPEAARQIVAALPTGVMKVGVFVNHGVAEIAAIAERVGLDGVQLQGDERPELIAQLPKGVSVVRAHRCGKDGLLPLECFLRVCRSAGRMPDAVLIDADAGPEFGGTGQRADWARIAQEHAAIGGLPLILAGGLTPDNVGAAIVEVRPDGVDVASGVERQPGVKDHRLISEFIAAAKRAGCHC